MSEKQPLKNHVAIVLDCSSSMGHIINDVQKVFTKQIEFLRKSSILFNQETRVSVYTFSNTVKCIINDVDVARPMEIGNLYAKGCTALLDAIGLAIEDMNILPQKYGDHAFLIYILTDGEENESKKYNANSFKSLMHNIPSNYTIAAFVPDNNSKRMMEGYGLSPGNVEKWDTTKDGIEEVGRKFEASMNTYYGVRSAGVKSSDTMFADLSSVSFSDVKKLLNKVKSYKIIINEATKPIFIRDLIIDKTGLEYHKGMAYYELVKTETVQASKHIAIQSKKTGEIFSGDEAKNLLALPNESVKLKPTDNKDWNIYIQSLSVNRNIIPKQRVLVIDK